MLRSAIYSAHARGRFEAQAEPPLHLTMACCWLPSSIFCPGGLSASLPSTLKQQYLADGIPRRPRPERDALQSFESSLTLEHSVRRAA